MITDEACQNLGLKSVEVKKIKGKPPKKLFNIFLMEN